MRAGLIAVLIAVCVLAPPAPRAQESAQAPAAVPAAYLTHYRAYRAAYDAGDLPTAVTEAQAALAAHEAERPADGTRAALSLNLAAALLDAGRGPEATAAVAQTAALPAETAPVDAALLALLQAHAGLLTDPTTGLAPALAAAEAAPLNDPILSVRALRLAQAAGPLALGADRHDEAIAAWRLVIRHAELGDLPADFLRGRALTGIAIATLMQGDERAAYDGLIEALTALAPFAAETETAGATVGQVAFAEALAWRAAAAALIHSNELRRPEWNGVPRPPSLAGRPAPCPLRVNTTPAPRFPVAAGHRGYVGAAVIRLSLDAAGAVTQAEALAFVPDATFAEAVDAVAPRWTVERAEDAPEGCRMERTGDLVTVMFTFAYGY